MRLTLETLPLRKLLQHQALLVRQVGRPQRKLLVQEMSGWYHATVRTCITLFQIAKGTVRPDSRPLIYDARARLAGIRDFALRRFGPPRL